MPNTDYRIFLKLLYVLYIKTHLIGDFRNI
nr:MAG TPA: hypothetical protein [Caudoviricetes sp.]